MCIQLIISNYFVDRNLLYDTGVSPVKYVVIGGVHLKSMLGQLLWNVMHDHVLRIKLPRQALIGYDDDIAIVITNKRLEE